MKRYLVTIALAALFWPLASYAFDFKGIVVGQPATPEQVFEKLTVRCGAGSANRQICNGTVSFGRETGQMNLVINERGIVQRIHIMQLPPSAFDSIAPLLVEKFGPPKSTDESELQNRMGAKFQQKVLLWTSPDDDLHVLYSKYSSRIDESSIWFSTKADRELMGRSKANRKGDL